MKVGKMSDVKYVDSVVECLCGNDVWGKPGDRCTHCVAEMEYIEILDVEQAEEARLKRVQLEYEQGLIDDLDCWCEKCDIDRRLIRMYE
jgi:hypothetical protein